MTSHTKLFAIATLFVAACATSTSSPVSTGASPSAGVTMRAPSPDPRVGLKAGIYDAGEAAWNLRLVSTTPPPEQFLHSTNSDLAFSGPYAIQGSYNGYQV